MQNVEETIISQYGNSACISALIYNMNAYIDPSTDIDNFYNFVYNVETAQGFGLQIWSRIVGISQSLLDGLSLTDDQLRSLIFLKALSNISYSSAPAINQLLQNWLGGTPVAYVKDLGNMAMAYVFEGPLESYQVAILQQSGIFLRPAGVLGNIIQTEYPAFGFSEMGTQWAWPFNQASFFPGAIDAA